LPGAAASALLASVLFGFAPASHAVTSRPGTTASPWTVQSTPNPTAKHGRLTGVSCVSSRFCVAVGAYLDLAGQMAALVEIWDGKTWKPAPTPKPELNVLNAVSCVATSFCEAVGGGPNGGVAEVWNGATWARQHLPDISIDSTFSAVTCRSMTFCEAVGYLISATWNGARWSASPVAATLRGVDLLSVSCPSVSLCFAVGNDDDNPVIEAWNGQSWTEQRTASGGLAGFELLSISCTSPSFCQATGRSGVGYFAGFAEEWNGAGWTIESPGPAGMLPGVVCLTSRLCEAVGEDFLPSMDAPGGGYLRALTERWNRTGWTMERQPALGPLHNALMAVSCTGPAFCEAVGVDNVPLDFQFVGTQPQGGYVPPDTFYDPWDWIDFGADYHTLAWSWNGARWNTQHTQNRAGVTNDLLAGVSCPALNRCQAVGWSGTGGAMASALGAKGWTARSTPNPSNSVARQLYAISCVSVSRCEAVGDNGDERNLVEAWDGVRWSTQAAANPEPGFGRLVGVSCVDAKFCEAVGYTVQPAATNPELTVRPQAERWNGSRWILQDSPALSGSPSELFGVAFVSRVFCIAVGGSAYFGGSVIEKWNGESWSLESHPDGPMHVNQLYAVSCTSAEFCQAVGCSTSNDCGPGRAGSSEEESLAEEWNGSQWQLSRVTKPGDGDLWGVSCSSDRFCAAVGDGDPASPLIEEWNGAAWTKRKAARVDGRLMGISCIGDGVCEAVGFRQGGRVVSTLAEHRRG